MTRALGGIPWTLAVAVALSGCFRSDQDRAVPTPVGESGFDLISYTGTTRGAYLWPDGNTRRICAEPPPDLGLNTAREISANLKAAAESLGGIGAPSIDAGGAAKLSSAAIELAGRSQLVLLTREFLYRECELAANFAPGSDPYKALAEQYAKVLDVVVTLAQADKAQAQKELIEIALAANNAEVAQEAKIGLIADAVVKPDGSIDPEKLRKLLEKAPISQSVKDVLLTETTRQGLTMRLDDLGDATINALLAARPS
jgi:hypothetical protein